MPSTCQYPCSCRNQPSRHSLSPDYCCPWVCRYLTSCPTRSPDYCCSWVCRYLTSCPTRLPAECWCVLQYHPTRYCSLGSLMCNGTFFFTIRGQIKIFYVVFKNMGIFNHYSSGSVSLVLPSITIFVCSTSIALAFCAVYD